MNGTDETTPTNHQSASPIAAELLLSLVVPVFNERDSLRPLYNEFCSVAASLPHTIEMIFIDDGSRDGSWEVLCALQEADDRVTAIRFRRNFGKAAALQAGFAMAHGERIFTLDADLQDDATEIPRFLERMDEGYDLVTGWKKVRHDPWHKTFPSRVFNWMVSRLTGVRLHDHNCGFKCYRDEVLDELQLYGEFHRFTPVLAANKGFRVAEIIVNHRARQYGQSKYGIKRFVRGLLDLLTVKFLTAYSNRPQHLLGGIGLLFLVAGSAGFSYALALWLVARLGYDVLPIGNRPLLTFSAAALTFGMQLLSIGLLAELIIMRSQDASHIYSIADKRLARARLKQAPEAPSS